MNHDRSRELYGRALSVMPGGVNSSVRATRPYPFFVQRGDGAHVVDADSVFKTVFTREGPAATDGGCAAGCEQRPDCPRHDHCPKTGGDVSDAETDRWERVFWQEMKDRGVFLTANQFEAQFVSYAHTEADVEETLAAYEAVL